MDVLTDTQRVAKGFKNQSPNMLKCLRVPAMVYKLPTDTGNIWKFLFLHIYFYIYIIYTCTVDQFLFMCKRFLEYLQESRCHKYFSLQTQYQMPENLYLESPQTRLCLVNRKMKLYMLQMKIGSQWLSLYETTNNAHFCMNFSVIEF